MHIQLVFPKTLLCHFLFTMNIGKTTTNRIRLLQLSLYVYKYMKTI